MELGDYWSALVRGWWLLVVFGLIGLAVSLVATPPPKGHISIHYTSSSVIGSPPVATNGGANLIGGGITIGQIQYYASTDRVAAETARLAGLNESLTAVRSGISLVAPSEASGQDASDQNGVVNVTASGPTAAAAFNLDQAFVKSMETETNAAASDALLSSEQQTEATLNTVMTDIATNHFLPGLSADALEVQVQALQSYLASLVIQQPGSGLQVVQAPAASVQIVSGTPTVVDNRTVRALAGFVIGLVVGVLAAIGLWLLDRRLKTPKRAELALGYPVVAQIPFDTTDATETYRKLWVTVFREPLPLPSAQDTQRWYDGENPVLDQDARSPSGQAGRL
jgi:hypothetical protein